jgi:hypothetical protein
VEEAVAELRTKGDAARAVTKTLKGAADLPANGDLPTKVAALTSAARTAGITKGDAARKIELEDAVNKLVRLLDPPRQNPEDKEPTAGKYYDRLKDAFKAVKPEEVRTELRAAYARAKILLGGPNEKKDSLADLCHANRKAGVDLREAVGGLDAAARKLPAKQEIGVISEYQSTARLGLPSKRDGGIPVLKDLPVLKELPLIGWFAKREAVNPTTAYSLIFARTSMYPGIEDVVDLLSRPILRVGDPGGNGG